MTRTKCEECGRKIVRKKVPYELYGVKIGEFPADVCQKCGEICFDEETSKKITNLTKEKGLWGLGTKTKVGKVGDSLDIRLNKKIVDFLGLTKGEEVTITPESRNKITITT